VGINVPLKRKDAEKKKTGKKGRGGGYRPPRSHHIQGFSADTKEVEKNGPASREGDRHKKRKKGQIR